MPMIEVHNASLKFNIHYVDQQMSVRRFLVMQTLRNALKDGFRNRWGSDESIVWALRDINLTIEKGEIVSLIGHNGAGKTTLLMVLAGIYKPDQGWVRVYGKIGTLLSLGGGFNNELSGIENIRLNGLFLGLDKKEIDAKTEQIIEFAELGKFINAPIRTYSAGMRARLGFSIAIHINPDVIIIDEVLQAGDALFQKKSSNLLETFAAEGKTVVIASHSLPLVEKICSRAIWLENGRIRMDAQPKEVVRLYTQEVNK